LIEQFKIMGHKITVLMPCYNGMKYIAEAVASVLAQSMQDWELIISDDGSKDGTIDYLKSLRDPRIIVHIQPKNLGIFGNLNFLFSCAAAPITQILCQDDYLIGADALQQILNIWSTLPEKVAFLRCNHGRDGSSGLQPLVQESLPPIIDSRDSDLFFFVFGCVPGNLSNVSVRTPVIARMGWFRTDLPYAGDFEFWSRTGREMPWASSRKHVVQVRLHLEQASITLNKKGELLSQLLLILKTLIRELRAQGYGAFDLRLAATVLYLARHLDGGFKVAVTGGGWKYFKLVNQSFMGADCFLSRRASWLMYVISGGGRLLGPQVAKRLILSRYRILARPLVPDTH
jgi:glycosyltransferase involved in cell wall biosynthesis